MGQYVDPAALTGNFKEVYGEEIIKLVPEQYKFLRMLPFVEAEKELGNKYHQPVLLTRSHGVTYAAADSGAFALNDHVAPQTKDAFLQGSQMLLRDAISYDAAARANRSHKAFRQTTQFIVEEMKDSMSYRLEAALLYGGVGLATVASSANVSGTVTTLTVTLAKWAVGMWAGAENCPLDAYESGGTKINTNAKLVVTEVSLDNRTIKVSGNSSDITALDTYIAANADATSLYFYGSKGNEMLGLDYLLSTSGSIFGIDNSVYNLWKGNSYSAGGALTMSKLLSAVAKGVERGLMQDVVALVNPNTWANLQSDLAALRRYDGSYSSEKSENGSREICYYGQNGEIKIVSHAMIKHGEAFIFPPKRVKRLGATDVTFNTPGRGEEIFLQMPNNAGFELRCYADMAIIIEKPCHCIKITGIVNS